MLSIKSCKNIHKLYNCSNSALTKKCLFGKQIHTTTVTRFTPGKYVDTRITVDKLNNIQPLPISLIGSDCLLRKSDVVNDVNSDDILQITLQLHSTLYNFRKHNNFGRGLSAPQIAVNKQIIALQLKDHFITLYNPVITQQPTGIKHEIVYYDDCLSIPDMLVRVKRSSRIGFKYTNHRGQLVYITNVRRSVSELIQHEIDHLHGILITSVHRTYNGNKIATYNLNDNAMSLKNFNNSEIPTIVHRSLYENNKNHYKQYVNYYIDNSKNHDIDKTK